MTFSSRVWWCITSSEQWRKIAFSRGIKEKGVIFAVIWNMTKWIQFLSILIDQCDSANTFPFDHLAFCSRDAILRQQPDQIIERRVDPSVREEPDR